MSTLEKLKKKFNEKPVPNDITIEDVIRLAKAYGCKIVTGGNHQIRIVYKPLGTVIRLSCHGKNVKEAYIVEPKELFSEIESKGGDEND